MKTFLSSLCIFTSILVSAQLEINDPCDKGICKLVEGCPAARRMLMATKRISLERCGWQGAYEIVCCPEEPVGGGGDIGDKIPPRKLVAACRKYGESVSTDVTTFIINGENASLGEFPHMAALGYESDTDPNAVEYQCAGSLISEQYVLTAAHCMVRKSPISVRLGKVDLFGNADNVSAQDIAVDKNIPHEEYDHFAKKNDIALIRLAKRVEFTTNVKPICLYTESDNPTRLFISGWGTTEVNGGIKGLLTRFLQKAQVSPVDTATCNVTVKKAILPSQLCALGEEEKVADTCQGDSGGPIQVGNTKQNYGTQYLIVGITSFGKSCATQAPGIYTRVFSYLDWIENIVW